MEVPREPGGGADEAFEAVYGELRRLASAWWRRRAGGDTLQPTALVHEAYMKLAGSASARWNDEEHFRAIAARAMRQALVSHARGKSREKRGGDWDRVTLAGIGTDPGVREMDVVDLDEALTLLESLNERHARVVELRFFAGMTEAEVARTLGVSERTVQGDWRAARAWLHHRLAEGGGDGS
jgi:RNA polymerase sigma-70 factor (ECF subfamily)